MVEKQNPNISLAVLALVALVAIVGLVALILQANHKLSSLSTGISPVRAQATTVPNSVGDVQKKWLPANFATATDQQNLAGDMKKSNWRDR